MMEYCWCDRVTNKRLFHEPGSRPIACTIRQCQLRLYGHVTCFLEVNLAYRAVFERDNLEWRRPKGLPQSSWLGKVHESCWDVPGMGRGPACRLAWRNPREWRSRVGEAMHYLAYAPVDWLIDWLNMFRLYHRSKRNIPFQSLPLFSIIFQCSSFHQKLVHFIHFRLKIL